MRAHVLQHVPFEGLGSIETWLKTAGYEITKTPFFQAASLPNPDDIDFLIIMGGPMSVNDEDEYPWLLKEKRFIRRCIEEGKSVLGICLGAQLITSALGARIYKNSAKEIGWFPIKAVPSIEGAVFRFPPVTEVFHWHGETFDLPSGAILLARSEGCENQAFQLGRSVIGLQFHLETTPESARQIVEHCRNELIPAAYVQSEDAILAASPEKYGAINNLMSRLLSFLQNSNRQPS
ncbi:GMP synthase-Glutamine amidotransferase [Syntrophus gentianae]|uniref:GMP synthase-Glutamine amidotransferase n=1 Tax=Syntrophus gentianae TaxID=43775 RepID=A0A1H7WE73_9BACT|nr:gamma-glutamyl-gamma-aminobutyrate hydrolase family protein [Syntrophus gentianae]SEM19892.1 GMP synthase-Glutamine amidotransferase [Syntrophus gentianae]